MTLVEHNGQKEAYILGLYRATCFPIGNHICKNLGRKVDNLDSGAVGEDQLEAARLYARQSTEIIDRWFQLNLFLRYCLVLDARLTFRRFLQCLEVIDGAIL
jgi:hypothetical protein